MLFPLKLILLTFLLYILFPEGGTTLKNVFEHKDKMRLGMSLTSNPKDNSFVVGVNFILVLFTGSVFIIIMQVMQKKSVFETFL